MINAFNFRKELSSLWDKSVQILNDHCAANPDEADGIYDQLAVKLRTIREEIENIGRQAEKKQEPIRPADQNAWSRIGDLAEAISHQYESSDGDVDAVRKYAEEITWQCSIIDSIG